MSNPLAQSPKHPSHPCGGCPFSRSVTPGALGGSPPEVFIGQALASMWLPCHALYEPGVGAKQQSPSRCGQCAGAAAFRANVGVHTSPGIHTLPPDRVRVFSDPWEFIAHHRKVSVEEVRRRYNIHDFIRMAETELRKGTVRIVPVA